MAKRVLQVLNGLGTGGIEKYVLDLFKYINPNEFVFDFLLRKKGYTNNELVRSLGGKIFYVSPYPEEKKKNYIDVDHFFSEHSEYDIAHIHVPSLEYVTILKLANKHKIKRVILHSHLSSRNTFKARFLHYTNRLLFLNCATDLFACSDKAARWMFGNHKYTFAKNGIDTFLFTYSKNIRHDVRSELGLDGYYVWGNIGRLCQAKNQVYLLHLFKKQMSYYNNSKLLIVGEGNDLLKLQVLAKKLEIEDKVMFLGFRKDIQRLMCAMDVLVFPSLIEGLPITLVEAQSMGLPCVVSDTITKQSEITDKMRFLSLKDSTSTWLKTINSFQDTYDRENYSSIVRSQGFDIRNTSKAIENFYLSCFN